MTNFVRLVYSSDVVLLRIAFVFRIIAMTPLVELAFGLYDWVSGLHALNW